MLSNLKKNLEEINNIVYSVDQNKHSNKQELNKHIS